MKQEDTIKLLEAAKAAQQYAYAPYSKYPVGAAVLTSDGRIFTGTNIENGSYGSTICAERLATWKAVSEGARGIVAVATVTPDGARSLCGSCLQVLSEFTQELIFVYGENDTVTRSLSDLFELSKKHSCFISYHHNDENFARKLNDRLKAENYQTWFFPNSTNPGDEAAEEIKQGIKYCNKFIIILSEQSMKSSWVTFELRRARKIEKEIGGTKIVPVSLIPLEIIKKWEAIYPDLGEDLAETIRGRNIKFFFDWQDSDLFENAFRELLKSLTSIRE